MQYIDDLDDVVESNQTDYIDDLDDIVINNYSLDNRLMDIFEFIDYNKINIETFMFDRFWNSLNDDLLIYIDDEIIKWMGYSSVEIHNRKKSFMKLLSEFELDKDYFEYNNEEYRKFLLGFDENNEKLSLVKTVVPEGTTENNKELVIKSAIYPKLDLSNGKNNTKYLLLTSDTLKDVMMINTTKGNKIRDYYLELQELFENYCL